jgi:tubulin alpha
MYSVM